MSERSRSLPSYTSSERRPGDGGPLAVLGGAAILLGVGAVLGSFYTDALVASRHTTEDARRYQQTAARLHALTGQVVSEEPSAELRREMLDTQAEYHRLHKQLEAKRRQGPQLALVLRVGGGLLLVAGLTLFSRFLR